MKGAIAAGHPLTARAGADVLAAGGNAFDACIAAAFVSWVAESPLTGPGAGGFLLAHRGTGTNSGPGEELLDFFVAVPGRALEGDCDEMDAVEVAFAPGNTQIFLVGAASCAVPGTVAGLADAHRRYATKAWAELIRPAIDLARGGVELNEMQAFLHGVLDPVLRLTPDSRRIYGETGALHAGDRISTPDLAATLELLADEGPEPFYRGELARRISECVRAQGGRITEDDLGAYRVVRRRPLRAAYRGADFVSNPPPSAGGVLIAFALRVLDRLEPGRVGSPEAIAALAAVMREATRARGGSFVRDLHRGGLAERLLGDERIDEAERSARERSGVFAREPSGLPSTTHISVVDGDGNAASLSASTGCGSGIVVPGTGIHLNNMLGEVDLNPSGGVGTPGRRLTSMMAPSLVVRDGLPRAVLGSAGSIRLRGAILQIVVNVVDHGMRVDDAVAAPRVHLEGERLHLEGGIDAEVADRLEAAGYDLVRWDTRNLYFGGASCVARGENGELEAAGDPRRGGTGLVVA
jgi:gamma-glutamyltranspeptidase/glutathione hydrolase